MEGVKIKDIYNFLIQEKYILFSLLIAVFFIIFVILIFLSSVSSQDEISCGDGTLYNSCSKIKPYFCSDGKLIDLASICECPIGFFQEDDSCISSYQNGPKEISLEYTIRGRKYSSTFTVYEEFANYTSEIPRSISYGYRDDYSRADFKIKAVSDDMQKKMLMPLVIKIQNMTTDKEDQARIAISIVQNIPFGASNKASSFGKYGINHSRYPYEVLYDMSGICGEKTDLLAFLLKELGYGVGFFYYPQYNHEAIGIKCPVKRSVIESGYCFVETTGPSIITDNKIYYSNLGRLNSIPEFYLISDGEILNNNLYEYSDAESLIQIRELVDENGYLWPAKKKMFEQLQQKYGLAENYYGG